MSWKTWTSIALIIVVIFAIYSFASPETPADPATTDTTSSAHSTGFSPNVPGVDAVHREWIEPQASSYRITRNLFSFREPPPPPAPPPPTLPPDRDKDSVPDFKDNCPDKYNPDQADTNSNGVGDICEEGFVPAPPPPPPPPVPPTFDFKYIGTFGGSANPIATFTRNGEIVNAHVGETIDGKFILRSIGIESVEIGYVGFPPDRRDRFPIGSD